MALDTREKRAASIMVALPWRGLLPLPDPGAEDQPDRQQVAYMAVGVLAESLIPGQPAAKRGGLWSRPQIAPANGMIW